MTLTWCFFCFLPQVKNVFEQEGFSRQKRGYRNINDIEVNMSDPLFTKQWYLVSNLPSCLTFRTNPHSSTLITQRPGIFPTTFWINVVIHSLISLANTFRAISSPHSCRLVSSPLVYPNWQPWLLCRGKLSVIHLPRRMNVPYRWHLLPLLLTFFTLPPPSTPYPQPPLHIYTRKSAMLIF